MLELDEKIWKKFYPDDKEDSKPELHTAYLWLKSDIVHILTDEAFDTETVENEIMAMIKGE